MYSPEERAELRRQLLECAAGDARITGAAITGSAAEDNEDRWSDIDLAFGLDAAADGAAVVADWTRRMYEEHGALHHMDVMAGPWTYRVFLLANLLQVDLAFVTEAEFRALAPSFRLVSGSAQEPRHMDAASPEALIRMAWLYALHARGSVARGKAWQAEYMISGVRDQAMALACLRHGVSAVHARGVDLLPAEVKERFAVSLVRSLDQAELVRAMRAVLAVLVVEISHADASLAARLNPAIIALGDSY